MSVEDQLRRLFLWFSFTFICATGMGNFCPARWPPECPGPRHGLQKINQSSVVISGVFSLSAWRVPKGLSPGGDCAACHPSGSKTGIHRFAVEQMEALIFATEMVNSRTSQAGNLFGYDITDSCGNHKNQRPDCISKLAPLERTLASIVGPYYADESVSLSETETISVYRKLSEKGSFDDKGVLSLLDVPFPYSRQIVDLASTGDFERTIMFQQTCELQALAAVDFVVAKRWRNVTVVGSGDLCGTMALRRFKERLTQKGVQCHFQVQYLQEEPREPSDTTNQTAHFLQPNYQIDTESVVSEAHFLSELVKRKHVVVLSSVPYAATLFESLYLYFDDIEPPFEDYRFLLGDFWGDPRRVQRVVDQIETLAEDYAYAVYGLRNAVNGTDKFQDHMASIQFNSSHFRNNTILQSYWEEFFRCSVAAGTCRENDTLRPSRRPILRNYKAPLIMDAVFAMEKYVSDYRQKNSNMLPEEFLELEDGETFEVRNDWTNNHWLFGMPGNGEEFEWAQPLEWTYEIMELFYYDDRLEGEVYGTWQLGLDEHYNRTEVLTLDGEFQSLSSFGECLDREQQVGHADCDSVALYPMSALPAVVALLLTVACFVWILRSGGGLDRVSSAIKSAGVMILGFSVCVAVSVSFWMIFGEEALKCDSRSDDFLMTVINSVCFTVLLICLVVPLITSRLVKLVVKLFGFLALVLVQVVVSAIAHFAETDKASVEEDPVKHCYDEHSKPLAVFSYLFSDILLVGCIMLLFYSLCSRRGDYYGSNGCFKFVSGFLALCLGIVYTTVLVIFVWIDGHGSCMLMGRLFIVLAVFPAIVCLVVITVLLLSRSDGSDDVFTSQSNDIGMNMVGRQLVPPDPHIYVFEGFPQLTARTSRLFSLDDDVAMAIEDVIIEPKRIRIITSVGSGNFGEVFKGMLDDSKPVAVKSVHDIENEKHVNDFIREGLQMKDFSHANVMELIGICWIKKHGSTVRPTAPLIVLPYMELGDLKSFLRKHRPGNHPANEENPISLIQLVKFGHQIAKGMEYLSAAGIVHRDLAARNCMVNWDLEIKVADFGLSRSLAGKDYYRMGQLSRLPVKWMAPECLLDLVFTSSSDVWSFGVTMWEVMTLAQVPYPGIDNQDILSYLKRENRLYKPDECPLKIYELMQQCWKTQPDSRPTFTAIVEDIEEYLSDMMNYFDPSAVSSSPPTDPYTSWKLMPISEESDPSDDSGDRRVHGGNTEETAMIRQLSSERRGDVSSSGQRSRSTKNSDSSSRVVRMVASIASTVSSGMFRRSSSSLSEKLAQLGNGGTSQSKGSRDNSTL